MSPPHPLEPDGEALRKRLRLLGDKLGRFVDGLGAAPAAGSRGTRRAAAAFDAPMPERGAPFAKVVTGLMDRAVPAALETSGPGYLAFVPGGGLVDGVLADLIAGITNRYTGLWIGAPAFVQIEVAVLRWLASVVGYGEQAGGVLLSGGSLANFAALVAARDDRLGRRVDDGVLYTGRLTHHSVLKAARMAAIGRVREVGGPGFELDPAALQQAVASDRAAGLRPFAVVASAGSTALGTVDPLPALADVAERAGLWLHVDGAYGGCFALTERGRAVLGGLERADSVALDPHKGLFLHYGTGALLVRDRQTLRRSFGQSSDYLPASREDDDRWDFAELGPELSRPARGLRLWLPLQVHGVAAFRDALDEKLDLAAAVHDELASWPGVRVVSPPRLSLLAVRAELGPEAGRDALNRRWIARTNDRRRVFLSGATVLEGGVPRFVVRVCVLSHRTHRDRIAWLLEDLRAGLEQARAELGG